MVPLYYTLSYPILSSLYQNLIRTLNHVRIYVVGKVEALVGGREGESRPHAVLVGGGGEEGERERGKWLHEKRAKSADMAENKIGEIPLAGKERGQVHCLLTGANSKRILWSAGQRHLKQAKVEFDKQTSNKWHAPPPSPVPLLLISPTLSHSPRLFTYDMYALCCCWGKLLWGTFGSSSS